MASGDRNWKGLVLERMKEMVVQCRQRALRVLVPAVRQ